MGECRSGVLALYRNDESDASSDVHMLSWNVGSGNNIRTAKKKWRTVDYQGEITTHYWLEPGTGWERKEGWEGQRSLTKDFEPFELDLDSYRHKHTTQTLSLLEWANWGVGGWGITKERLGLNSAQLLLLSRFS